MYYGTAYLGLPNDRKIAKADLEQKLNWQFSNNKPTKISKKDFIEANDPQLAKKRILRKFG